MLSKILKRKQYCTAEQQEKLITREDPERKQKGAQNFFFLLLFLFLLLLLLSGLTGSPTIPPTFAELALPSGSAPPRGSGHLCDRFRPDSTRPPFNKRQRGLHRNHLRLHGTRAQRGAALQAADVNCDCITFDQCWGSCLSRGCCRRPLPLLFL